jgi:hypothetical protein
MLMYRKIDKKRNCEDMKVDEFNENIKDLIKKIKKSEESDRMIREKEMKMCKIRIYVKNKKMKKVVE